MEKQEGITSISWARWLAEAWQSEAIGPMASIDP
jgi:hypothetical protein